MQLVGPVLVCFLEIAVVVPRAQTLGSPWPKPVQKESLPLSKLCPRVDRSLTLHPSTDPGAPHSTDVDDLDERYVL